MAFLDKKERVLDIVLTQEGRKLLAQNDLDFAYYAFSDDGIDYSGSMTTTQESGESFDQYMVKENLFEAVSKNDSIKYRLYTIDPSVNVLPKIKIDEEDIEPTLSFALERKYTLEKSPNILARKLINKEYVNDPLAAIIRSDQTTNTDARNEEKAINDATLKTMANMARSNTISPGSIIGSRYIVINDAEAIDKQTGMIINLSEINPNDKFVAVSQVSDDIEVVLGISEREINLSLLQEGAENATNKGFLIEVYESGSDGRVEKLPAEDTYIEATEEEMKKEGFLRYLNIIVDDGEE
jgi:chorismate mutase